MIDNSKYSIILPARIVEYFPEDQTATVQISVETIYNNSESLYEIKKRQPLEGVPVHTPSGGGWAITMPIKEGDSCIMFFSQVGYDHWLYEDKDSAGLLAGLPKPWMRRQFNEDDGYALVGLNTIPRAIKSYTMDGSQWRNEDAIQNIHLKEDLSIEINSPVSVTINAPSVVVNCDTSEVNAGSSASITTPKTTIDSPETEITGNVVIGGNVEIGGNTEIAGTLLSGIATVAGLAVAGGGSASVSGSMSVDGDVTASGKSLVSHTHVDSEGGNTSPPS